MALKYWVEKNWLWPSDLECWWIARALFPPQVVVDLRVAVFLKKVIKAEDTNHRSKAMSMMSVDLLCTLLKFVVQRMKYSDVSFCNLLNQNSFKLFNVNCYCFCIAIAYHYLVALKNTIKIFLLAAWWIVFLHIINSYEYVFSYLYLVTEWAISSSSRLCSFPAIHWLRLQSNGLCHSGTGLCDRLL